MVTKRFDADADDPLTEMAIVLVTPGAAELVEHLLGSLLGSFVDDGDVAVLAPLDPQGDIGAFEELRLEDLAIVRERGTAQWFALQASDGRPWDTPEVVAAAARALGPRLLVISAGSEISPDSIRPSAHLDLEPGGEPHEPAVEGAVREHVRSVTGESRTELQRSIEPLISDIAEATRKHTSFDLRHYKRGTLLRRVTHRIQTAGSENAAHYLAQLSVDPAEAAELVQSMLIGVTTFFRDPHAFEALGRILYERLAADGERRASQPFRIWVPGCASGEEAFSLVILATEVLEQLGLKREIRLFATDLSHKSLAAARRSEYGPEVEEHVSAERLDRFFQRSGDRWRVRPEIRQCVTFSLHNLINDAPLNRMDLVSCRNLLIYLGPHLQQKLFPVLHFALIPGGHLFLGPSESVLQHKRLFDLIDPDANVSVRRGAAAPTEQPLPQGAPPLPPAHEPDETHADLLKIMNAVVVDEFMPPSVLVDEDGGVHTASADMSRFLTVTAGTFRNNVVAMAREGLRRGLRSALAEAAEFKRRAVADRLWMRSDKGLQQVSVTVQPMPRAGAGVGLYLVVFHAVGLPQGPPDAEKPHHMVDTVALDAELSQLRLEYESSLQRFEAANEELKSSNEELISMNEELRSTNDELSASKEEVEEGRLHLEKVHAELENLVKSTDVATVFLDTDRRILRFTPAAKTIFNLRDGDVGRPLSDVTSRASSMPELGDPENEAPVRVELDDGTVVQRRVSTFHGASGDALGLVINFDDVTEIVHAAEESRGFLRSLVNGTNVMLGVCDAERRMIECNTLALRAAGVEFEDLDGVRFEKTPWWAHSAEVREEVRAIVERGLEGHTTFEVLPFQTYDGSVRYVDFQCSPLPNSAGQIEHVVVSGFDITERRELSEQLKISIRRLELALSAVRMGTWWWYYDGNELRWDEAQRLLWDVDSHEPITLELAKDRIYEDDQPLVMDTMNKAIEDRASYALEFRIVLRDGTIRWLGARGEVFRDEQDGRNVLLGVNWDITDERKRDNQLFESQRLQRLGFESARIGTIEIVPDLDQVVIDGRGAELLGLNSDSTTRLSEVLSLGIVTEDRARVAARLEKAQGSKQHGRFAIDFRARNEVVRKKGNREERVDRWIRLQGRRYAGRKGDQGNPREPIKLQGVVMDVTRQRENEQALLAAREAAEAANRAKSEFLANMSHEIRTPMTAILGYADVLARHLKDPDNQELVETIRRNGYFLLEIINDILDLAKIESGALPVQRERFAPEAVLEEVATLMHVRAVERGIALGVEYAEALPKLIESDPVRLRQVLLNLVGNAIKFTDEGRVTIRASAPGVGADARLLIEVIDTGIGIPEADLSTLFQPFTQVDNSLRRERGGTGLGLTISRRLCHALDGDLTVKSTPGEGSTFIFSMPLRLVDQARHVPAAPTALRAPKVASGGPTTLKGTTVLIVDDRRDVRTLVQFLFEDVDAETLLASNGQEAVDVYRSGAAPDLVVMDMQMPVMDGYAATTELRRLGATIPIIAVTAHAMQGEREKCLEAGCSDYATKPIDGERLLAQAASLLGLAP